MLCFCEDMIDWKGILWKFEEDDMVFLKVAHWKGVIRFKNRGKLNLKHFGPFRILKKIGSIAYRLKLPSELSWIHNVFHVSMLKKYVPDPSHILEVPPIVLEENLSFGVQPLAIIEQEMKQLRSKVIPMVKVLWRSDTIEEMIGNRSFYEELLSLSF